MVSCSQRHRAHVSVFNCWGPMMQPILSHRLFGHSSTSLHSTVSAALASAPTFVPWQQMLCGLRPPVQQRPLDRALSIGPRLLAPECSCLQCWQDMLKVLVAGLSRLCGQPSSCGRCSHSTILGSCQKGIECTKLCLQLRRALLLACKGVACVKWARGSDVSQQA